MLGQTLTFFRIQLRRHLHNPTLWLIGMAAPIAANYMVPEDGKDYTVVGINNAFPILTPSVIGMELGIIAALLLSPLAYIFLRASRVKHTPWQVEDVTPARRSSQMFGHWLADTTLLSLLLLGLAVSGIILSIFRLSFGEINPFVTVFALIVIAVPAFAFIAAIRLFFSARPWLRGAWGDVMFFIIWMAGVVVGAAFFQSNASAYIDMFGYAASMKNAVDVPIEAYSVGSAPTGGGVIAVDAMRGVTEPSFLRARLFWIILAGVLALFAGFIYKPRKMKQAKKRLKLNTLKGLDGPITAAFNRARPNTSKRFAPLWTEISETFKPRILLPILIAISIVGAFLPFRLVIGPLLWLILIFPLTAQSGRWQARALKAFTSTFPQDHKVQFIWACTAAIVMTLTLCLPSAIRIMLSGNYAQMKDIVFIGVFVPLIIMALGRLTTNGITARLLMLIVWYGYLNM